MSPSLPPQTERASKIQLGAPDLHSSVDLEAIVAEQIRIQDQTEIDMSEPATQVLERLRLRIGQLYGATDYDHTLSRLGSALLALEVCISRLNQNEQAVGEVPSLIAIIREFEKSCVTIEHHAKLKRRDEAVTPSPILTKLIEVKSENEASRLIQIERHIFDLRKAIENGTSIEIEQFGKILEQLTALRELHLSENRKLFASIGAIHATIERCVDRLSRVEYSLMEARSIETSSAIAGWPEGMQSINLSFTEPDERPTQKIDPRRALTAAARASSRAEKGRI